MIAIGIDPGVNTGFALWDTEKRILTEVTSVSILAAIRLCEQMHRFGSLHSVTFEDARMRTWFGSKGAEALQGAGSIKRDCSIWAEFLGELGAPYKSISPHGKGRKLTAPEFARLTGWKARTNNHGRDAAMLVFGMKG